MMMTLHHHHITGMRQVLNGEPLKECALQLALQGIQSTNPCSSSSSNNGNRQVFSLKHVLVMVLPHSDIKCFVHGKQGVTYQA